MPIHTLVFDFDGTLADTLPLCVEAYRCITEEHTGTRPSVAEVEHFFGLSDRGVLGGLLNIQPDAPELAAPLARFVEIYQQLHPSLAPQPFDGVMDMLATLKQRGFRLALITGKEDFTAIPSLEYFNMLPYFDYLAYGEPDFNAKSLRLNELMNQFQLRPEELIYIGDAPSDITSCQEVGVPIINAAWAADSARYAADCIALAPTYRISSIADLQELLLSLH
ncbi:MAG: HAD family hydrolase [Akkermansia sp.]